MLVVNRFRVAVGEQQPFRADLGAALDALAQRPGFRAGRIGRAADDIELLVLTTEWDSVGAYRRALSGYDVKVTAIPVLSRAVDEPGAYEVLVALGPGSEGLVVDESAATGA